MFTCWEKVLCKAIKHLFYRFRFTVITFSFYNVFYDICVVCTSRTTYIDEGFQGETQLLKPVSLDLEILRNLSSNWYHSIPDIEIIAHLKPMSVRFVFFESFLNLFYWMNSKLAYGLGSIRMWELLESNSVICPSLCVFVCSDIWSQDKYIIAVLSKNCVCSKQLLLCQDDMIVVLRTLSENLSEKSDADPPPARPPTTDPSSDSVSNKESQGSGTTGPASSKGLWLCLFALLCVVLNIRKLDIRHLISKLMCLFVHKLKMDDI